MHHYLGAQLSYDMVVRPEIACIAPLRCGNYGSAAEFSECDPLVCLLSSEYSLLFLFRTARLAPRFGLACFGSSPPPHLVPTEHEIGVDPIASPDIQLWPIQIDP